MVSIKRNTVRLAGLVALLCVSLACFAYINSIQPQDTLPAQEIFVEELNPASPDVLPDVELLKRIVRKAFEFMSETMF